MLGEEFDSLAQARRALKRESVPVKKAVKKQLPKQYPKSIIQSVIKPLAVPQKLITKFESPAELHQPKITVSPKQKVISIRELKDGDRRKITDYFDDRLNANALDKALLKPGERWAAQVEYRYTGKDGKIHTGYAKTYDTFPSAYSMFKRLSGYMKHAKVSANQKANWMNQIKVIKWGGTEAAWDAAKKKEKAASDKRRKAVGKLIRKGKERMEQEDE
jgi:hypothetical protein